MKKHALNMLLFALAGLFVISLLGYTSGSNDVFSPEAVTSLWHDFRKNYIEASTGRTVSNDPSDATTSELQAWTMLRAVWMNDQTTFDRAWAWTKTYLRHKDDRLFASYYGKRQDGSYGIDVQPVGQHSYSGADADIALSLFFAYARWGQPVYAESGRLLLDDIWNHEVIFARGRPYLAAGSLEETKNVSRFVVNPSAFPLYALRTFAGMDPQHDWMAVLNTSYDVIQKSTLADLDKKDTARVPPDYVMIERTTGEIVGTGLPAGQTTNFGTQAQRLPFRLFLDWQWYGDERAKNALTNMELLGVQWRERQRLAAAYTHDGQVTVRDEHRSVYGGSLGYFLMTDPQAAERIRNTKLVPAYDVRRQVWKKDVTGFDATWVWLGLALSEELLPNLIPHSTVNQVHEQFIKETPLVIPSETPSDSPSPAVRPRRQ